MTIKEFQKLLMEMIEQSEEYRENAKGAYDEGYEEGWYEALNEVLIKSLAVH